MKDDTDRVQYMDWSPQTAKEWDEWEKKHSTEIDFEALVMGTLIVGLLLVIGLSLVIRWI